ncbi:beta-defensin 132 [Neofelis nebulosa]|uniref:beta-defensin 132 n=1 Tax=Neofelis nebulosa TaxID=61452 RepID=UPI00272B3F41|nr:beta-defensin 132 [Neofelis nebulosa]
MKLLFLVFASLGLMVTPASGGGSSCGRKFPGHCRLPCSSLERSAFVCDRSKRRCTKDHGRPIAPPPVHRSKQLCRTATKSQTEKQPTATTPRPRSPIPQPRCTTRHRLQVVPTWKYGNRRLSSSYILTAASLEGRSEQCTSMAATKQEVREKRAEGARFGQPC